MRLRNVKLGIVLVFHQRAERNARSAGTKIGENQAP